MRHQQPLNRLVCGFCSFAYPSVPFSRFSRCKSSACQAGLVFYQNTTTMAKKKSDNKKESKADKKARVHPELDGFEIKINPLGDISSNFNIDQLNEFLDRNVTDKKLVGDQGKKRVQEEEEYPIEENVDEEENEEDFFKGSTKLDDEEEEDNSSSDEDEDLPARKPKKK